MCEVKYFFKGKGRVSIAYVVWKRVPYIDWLIDKAVLVNTSGEEWGIEIGKSIKPRAIWMVSHQ